MSRYTESEKRYILFWIPNAVNFRYIYHYYNRSSFFFKMSWHFSSRWNCFLFHIFTYLFSLHFLHKIHDPIFDVMYSFVSPVRLIVYLAFIQDHTAFSLINSYYYTWKIISCDFHTNFMWFSSELSKLNSWQSSHEFHVIFIWIEQINSLTEFAWIQVNRKFTCNQCELFTQSSC